MAEKNNDMYAKTILVYKTQKKQYYGWMVYIHRNMGHVHMRKLHKEQRPNSSLSLSHLAQNLWSYKMQRSQK